VNFFTPRLHALVGAQAYILLFDLDISERCICFSDTRLQSHFLTCQIGIAVDREITARHKA
jgi:hypothetical protein